MCLPAGNEFVCWVVLLFGLKERKRRELSARSGGKGRRSAAVGRYVLIASDAALRGGKGKEKKKKKRLLLLLLSLS